MTHDLTDPSQQGSEPDQKPGCCGPKNGQGCPWTGYAGVGLFFVIGYSALWMWSIHLRGLEASVLNASKSNFSQTTILFITIGSLLADQIWFPAVLLAAMVFAIWKRQRWGIWVLWAAALLVTVVAFGGLLFSSMDLLLNIPAHG